jgi:hypothetical protein
MLFACLLFAAPALATAPDDVDTRSFYEIHTPIGDDFRTAFSTRTSTSVEEWLLELGRFYRTDGKLVFRGVCNDASQTLSDFIHTFAAVSPNLMSKNSVTALREAAREKKDYDLRRAILAEFSRYDHDAYLYSLHEEVNVHQRGPVPGNEAEYARSYGFSTSWSFWMATEFAGAYPGDESCANSMVFGSYPALHFVDYGNLERVDARFKRLYPDERETLGVGAVDPDALALIIRVEAKDGARPAITEILVRNPSKPGEVLLIDGGVDVLDEELAAGWDLLQKDKTDVEAAFRRHGVRPPTPPRVPDDSRLRLPPGAALAVTRDGVALVPRAKIPLDYALPLFPPATLPQH